MKDVAVRLIGRIPEKIGRLKTAEGLRFRDSVRFKFLVYIQIGRRKTARSLCFRDSVRFLIPLYKNLSVQYTFFRICGEKKCDLGGATLGKKSDGIGRNAGNADGPTLSAVRFGLGKSDGLDGEHQ
ncbi:hypothetical protein BXT84_14050 [Sulfobacillus thermotolerans]|uniref:Uncharacterized protein n=1 Tax=Sulfobacillus thermotolerans TaxID=338644 RepID=A0ABN5H2W1_9FIRM|nr:hypothetical protein BXT84_14050 [Sulfobacillus thermotolerans]